MHPTNLLLLAKWLTDGPVPPEMRPAASRAAISRAYYAAYHVAHGFLQALDCPVDRGGREHRDIRAWLDASGVHDLAYAAKVLGDLHEMRILADYGIESPDTEASGTVAQALDQAEEIITIVNDCAANQALSASIRSAFRSETLRRRL
jgi:hypothetical protein